ncbi:hypothetical protein GCM10010371_60740 [Streptomyces subrutilus]|uniref:Uncharacterized protein n=1 Tax=Streptomyces subrutilus TaxID=36818 RepID=A0A918RCW4_9ACTN|nr:hypothetical protein GCM10010371_60740 [Streptomyces subrutilus]
MLAQLGEGQHAGAAAGEVGEGEGRVLVHDAEVPSGHGLDNPCYKLVDKSGQDRAKVRAFDCR